MGTFANVDNFAKSAHLFVTTSVSFTFPHSVKCQFHISKLNGETQTLVGTNTALTTWEILDERSTISNSSISMSHLPISAETEKLFQLFCVTFSPIKCGRLILWNYAVHFIKLKFYHMKSKHGYCPQKIWSQKSQLWIWHQTVCLFDFPFFYIQNSSMNYATSGIR